MNDDRPQVLIVSSNFFPEETGIAVYVSDLALSLTKNGFDVTILTGLPHYPWWRIPEELRQFTAGESNWQTLRVLRTSHFIPSKGNLWGRARLEISFLKNGLRTLKSLKVKNSEELDLVIAFMPTLASGFIARKVAKSANIPSLVVFQDVTSLATLQSGMPGAKYLHRIAKQIERFSATSASKLIAISHEMEAAITKIVNGKISISVIYNYSTRQLSSLDHKESKLLFSDYLDKYLVIHTGNIGYKQDLTNIVNAAEILESFEDIHFLIIGDGNQKSLIQEKVKTKKNIEVLPFVVSESYPTLLSAADILLVNERSSLREMSLPSKLTSYLNSGRPIVAAVSSQSSTKAFLDDAAFIVEPENPQQLADAILKIKNDRELQKLLAEKALNFAMQNLSTEAGRLKYKLVIQELLDSKPTMS